MRRVLLLLTLCCLLAPGAAFAAGDPALAITPPSIRIGALYNGIDLTVTGKAPAGAQVAVRLSGEPDTFHMKQKGKALGVLWMNLDKVTFTGAPKVFLIAASDGLPEASMDHLGIPGLAERITAEAKSPDKAGLIKEFLHYQRSEKLYKDHAGTVTFGPEADGMRPFTAVLHVPSRLSPGAYAVEAFAVAGGTETALGEVDVTASFVGIPAFMANMAFNHGLLFGILASIIAILGGFVIGQLCSGSKSGAH